MVESMPLAEELSHVYAQMSGLLLTHETVESSLRLVTSLASEALPGTAGAGVSLMNEQGRRTSSAASDEVVEKADELQYRLDEGPCLDAWRRRSTVRVGELASNARWPTWASAVVPLGLRSVLSTPLVAGDESFGAIKVYSREPDAYGPHSEHLMRMFSAQAAVLIANVRSLDDARHLSEQLKDAIRTRDVIGMAKGALMMRDGIDEAQAFAKLATLSQQSNRKLRMVAEDVVRACERRRR